MNCVDVGHDEYADNSSENALYCFSKETAPCKHVEEVNQLFQKNPKKKSAKIEDKKDLVLPTLKECVAEAEVLYQYSNLDPEFRKFEMQYKDQFREWSFLLATNQSILLYGLGSKRAVLFAFGQDISTEGDVVSLDGFDPEIDLWQFLDYIAQLFLEGDESRQSNVQTLADKKYVFHSTKEPRKGLIEHAAILAKRFASTRSRPLFILIHNVDGVGLRNRFAQDALATLTANSKKDGLQLIRVAASVDNINSAMTLWDTHSEDKFDWVSLFYHF